MKEKPKKGFWTVFLVGAYKNSTKITKKIPGQMGPTRI